MPGDESSSVRSGIAGGGRALATPASSIRWVVTLVVVVPLVLASGARKGIADSRGDRRDLGDGQRVGGAVREGSAAGPPEGQPAAFRGGDRSDAGGGSRGVPGRGGAEGRCDVHCGAGRVGRSGGVTRRLPMAGRL